MKSKVRDAFAATRDGYSADRVICDPILNASFVAECRRLGLNAAVEVLNRFLMNLRKTGQLRGLTRSRKTSFKNEDDYRFATEMAARHLERRYCMSLDDVLCDPGKAAEFDELAGQIAPGYSSLQYRWAAINLRKARKLRPEIIAQAIPSTTVCVQRIEELDLATVPVVQSLYVFFAPTQTLYVGEAENLRTRIQKHLDHSDNKGLARWMWQFGTESIHLELHQLDPDTATRVRRALEAELIASRRPVFNVQRRFTIE